MINLYNLWITIQFFNHPISMNVTSYYLQDCKITPTLAAKSHLGCTNYYLQNYIKLRQKSNDTSCYPTDYPYSFLPNIPWRYQRLIWKWRKELDCCKIFLQDFVFHFWWWKYLVFFTFDDQNILSEVSKSKICDCAEFKIH